MAADVLPRKKMRLRTKVKPPKRFTGDIHDNISSSILGDRTLDSTDLENTCGATPLVLPAPIPPQSSRDSSAEKRTPKPSFSKEVLPAKITCSKGVATRLSDSQPSLPRKGWQPGRGMTPAKNSKYLGVQSKYDESLPPAAFPTLDTQELSNAWERGCTPYDTLKSPRQLVQNDTVQDARFPLTRTSYGPTSREEKARDVWLDSGTQVEKIPNPKHHSPPETRLQLTGDDDRTPKEIWDGLSIYWRLEVVDSIASTVDCDIHQILYFLELTPVQILIMEKLLLDRTLHSRAENRTCEFSNQYATRYLMQRKTAITEDRFRAFLNRTVYGHIDKADELQTNPYDRQDAELLLSKVGLTWELPYDAITPFTPSQQQNIEKLKKGQLVSQVNCQSTEIPESGSIEHGFSAPDLEQSVGLSKSYTYLATAQMMDHTAKLGHPTPPPTYRSSSNGETDTPVPNDTHIVPELVDSKTSGNWR